ncbi:Protein of unknown function [Amycolatopsis marina]|uniref:DUF2537 domain-containing protein n=1 Tax=Amycolatopsis marina TaxID=490629 RepID=A0A1I1CMP5_9PSEU|nr:DUF2537 domain-containing protein [Amycolatopsis marina]SFB62178.1 Protein of unknown function [Amycolatopsis marina]
MELRVEGERAVLGAQGREVDLRSVALAIDLADALQEWARVAAALRRASTEAEAEPEAARMVSQRGRQLAGRVAAAVGTPVTYVDPVTSEPLLVSPPARPPASSRLLRRFLGPGQPSEEPTPWGTGLLVAAFVAVVAVVAMLALATTLATETAGWIAVAAALVVTLGLAPSLWLARKLPVLRWVVLGVAAGVATSWIGVLVIAF